MWLRYPFRRTGLRVARLSEGPFAALSWGRFDRRIIEYSALRHLRMVCVAFIRPLAVYPASFVGHVRRQSTAQHSTVLSVVWVPYTEEDDDTGCGPVTHLPGVVWDVRRHRAFPSWPAPLDLSRLHHNNGQTCSLLFFK